MKFKRIKTEDTIIKGFPYQLLDWQKTFQKIENALIPFIGTKDSDYGIIIQSSRGFSIFTRGKNLTLGAYSDQADYEKGKGSWRKDKVKFKERMVS